MHIDMPLQLPVMISLSISLSLPLSPFSLSDQRKSQLHHFTIGFQKPGVCADSWFLESNDKMVQLGFSLITISLRSLSLSLSHTKRVSLSLSHTAVYLR
jgi:hypothetical protein